MSEKGRESYMKRFFMRRSTLVVAATLFILGLAILLFEVGQYQVISMLMVIVACIPIYYRYERKKLNIKELVLIAILTTTAVLGRFLFYMIPAITPMTAIIIISGICMGAEIGFLVGSLSAVTSNMLFGYTVDAISDVFMGADWLDCRTALDSKGIKQKLLVFILTAFWLGSSFHFLWMFGRYSQSTDIFHGQGIWRYL